ncbi:hypothetical protein FALBO_10574 [Fusarium albosuccineum]|uniref:Uncharacterized protein n=1 Tax=Fusarium albosuccineum TaxID=1237068 RepID=A0A8H4L7H4_9HYPO|nr:hypothetical protein FALBO_10574 [Fusarium albosuccineum]
MPMLATATNVEPPEVVQPMVDGDPGGERAARHWRRNQSAEAASIEGKGLIIYFNDAIDSDDLTFALALMKFVSNKPNVNVIWIIEPRKLFAGAAMANEERKECQDLTRLHVPEHGKPFKMLLAGLLSKSLLDERPDLSNEDRNLKREPSEPQGFTNKSISSAATQERLRVMKGSWMNITTCASIAGTNRLDELCHATSEPKSTRLFGGASLQLARNLRERGVAGKVECYHQVRSCDLKGKVLLVQYNLTMNIDAARDCFERSSEFLKFHIIPTHTTQSILWRLAGLKKPGGDLLFQIILGYSYHEDPLNMVRDREAREKKDAEDKFKVRDLIAFSFMMGLIQTGDKHLKPVDDAAKSYIHEEDPKGVFVCHRESSDERRNVMEIFKGQSLA